MKVMCERKTISELSEFWKEDKRKFVKDSTMSAYAMIIENHIIPAFGTRKKIRKEDIQKFALDKLGEGLSMKTVRDILTVLKMIVRYGSDNGMSAHVDCAVKLPSGGARPGLHVLSRSEQKKIMRHVMSKMTAKSLGIYICLSTGIRIGEICGLMWGDIDTKRRMISIRRTIERIYITDGGGRRTQVVANTPKTRCSMREIPLTSELARILERMKRGSDDSCYVLSGGPRPTEPRTYRSYYSNMMRELGIPHRKFHGLRHSFATRCIESNCDYKTVSALLGHSSVNTTLNLYVHPNFDQKRRCVEQMIRSLK